MNKILPAGVKQNFAGYGELHASDLKPPLPQHKDSIQIGESYFSHFLQRARGFVQALCAKRLSLDQQLETQQKASETLILKHFLPNGAIVASFDKPYYYDWGRDAAIVFKEVLQDGPLDAQKENLLDSQLNFDEQFRKNAPQFPGGLGEARTDVNANWAGPWGTPQFDAAALKASAFSDYGLALIQKGETQKASSLVYPAVHDYLEYLIAANNQPCFDPWEEIKAQKHFWTEMTKAVAFEKGSQLAKALGNLQDAQKYDNWSKQIVSSSLQNIFFQDKGDRIIFPSYQVLNPGAANKYTILDSQVLGALLLGGEIGYPVSLDNPFALHTFASILRAFKAIYPINQNTQDGAVAIGRYPDDVYGGPDAMGKGGNPWIICTLWAGQYDYRLAQSYLEKGSIDLSQGQKEDLETILGFSLPSVSSLSKGDPMFSKVVKRLGQLGDAELNWVLQHSQPGGNLSEQIDRNTGAPASVLDLAWSHAEFLRTLHAREALQGAMVQEGLQSSSQQAA
jgi:glucoamylase